MISTCNLWSQHLVKFRLYLGGRFARLLVIRNTKAQTQRETERNRENETLLPGHDRRARKTLERHRLLIPKKWLKKFSSSLRRSDPSSRLLPLLKTLSSGSWRYAFLSFLSCFDSSNSLAPLVSPVPVCLVSEKREEKTLRKREFDSYVKLFCIFSSLLWNGIRKLN